MRTVITRSGIALKDLSKDIADQLVLTTWWEKVVDQSATEGHVIMSPTQTWQYRTATANQIDNGVDYLANGKTYRYEQPSALGEEKFYLKLKPNYDASALWKGFWFQASNALNATNDDVVYDNNGSGGQENTKCKDASGNYIAYNAFTNNYPHRTQTTNRGVSPTNTNYQYFSGINPFNSYYSKTNTVSYRLFVYHTVDIDNPQNREDFVLGVCWGDDPSYGYVRTFAFGVPKSLIDWYGQNFGASRGGFASSDCYGTGLQSSGFVLLGGMTNYYIPLPSVSYEWSSYTINNYSTGYQYINHCLSSLDNLGGLRIFVSTPTYNSSSSFGYVNQSTSMRKRSLNLRDTTTKDLMCKGKHYIMPAYNNYHLHGSTSTQNNVCPNDPLAELPFGDDVFSLYPSVATSRFGSGLRTSDIVEYEGKRYFVVYGCNSPIGSPSSNNCALIYLEDV